jgi:hypothetical protein
MFLQAREEGLSTESPGPTKVPGTSFELDSVTRGRGMRLQLSQWIQALRLLRIVQFFFRLTLIWSMNRAKDNPRLLNARLAGRGQHSRGLKAPLIIKANHFQVVSFRQTLRVSYQRTATRAREAATNRGTYPDPYKDMKPKKPTSALNSTAKKNSWGTTRVPSLT